jgi:hypothetical protein
LGNPTNSQFTNEKSQNEDRTSRTGAMGVIHVKALGKIAGVEVVSIASRTEESGKAFADEWKIPFHSTSLEACIDRPGVDAVILTTPSDQHADQTVLALSKGKHVQVEIPMALNLADSQRMLAAAKKAGRPAWCAHAAPAAPHWGTGAGFRRGMFHLHHMVVKRISSGDQSQHAWAAAVVGRQPAVASRLSLRRHRAMDRQES